MLAPEDIKWAECPPFPTPGGQCGIIEGDPQASNALFTIRSKLADHYRISPHFLPTDEHITVLSGTFKMGLGAKFDESELKPMSTGSFMVIPNNSPHFALPSGETIVQVHATGPNIFTYIDPKNDPRNE